MLAGRSSREIQMRNLAAAACALLGAFAVAPRVAEAQTIVPGAPLINLTTPVLLRYAGAVHGGPQRGWWRRLPGKSSASAANPPASAAAEPLAATERADDGHRTWCAPDQKERLLAPSISRTSACDRSAVQERVAAGRIPRRARRPVSPVRRRRLSRDAGKGSSGHVIGVDPDARIRTYIQRDGVGADGVSGYQAR